MIDDQGCKNVQVQVTSRGRVSGAHQTEGPHRHIGGHHRVERNDVDQDLDISGALSSPMCHGNAAEPPFEEGGEGECGRRTDE